MCPLKLSWQALTFLYAGLLRSLLGIIVSETEFRKMFDSLNWGVGMFKVPFIYNLNPNIANTWT